MWSEIEHALSQLCTQQQEVPTLIQGVGYNHLTRHLAMSKMAKTSAVAQNQVALSKGGKGDSQEDVR